MEKDTVKKPLNGFTLIELLVVIAVIALLLSISLPSLRRAREAGQRITCLSHLKALASIVHLYAAENDNKVPSGDTEGPLAWVNHAGGLAYYNIDTDPILENEQKEAIRRGLLWPYAGQGLEVFRCPTSRLGQARSYSMPDSFNYTNLGLLAISGAPANLLITNLAGVRNSAGRMLFIDEGWATPTSWSIMFKTQQWWDIVPERHAAGTTLAFIDGHAEYWKWVDERTRAFAKEAAALNNPNDATYWRKLEPGNEDITRLVTAVWGHVGWTENDRR
jgi:prepilin-type N-terminal cleavage/methylation domain-containing protein/prepilin-type processing-associated H-X9-DG protein